MLAFENSRVKDKQTLRKWQQEARGKLKEILRVDISTRPKSVRSQRKVQTENITRETLILEKNDGSQIPGFLLLPQTPDPRPVIIVIPSFSHGIISTAGIAEDYLHSIGLRLAEAGYVVLTLEIRTQGYLYGMGETWMTVEGYCCYVLNHGRSLSSFTVSDASAGLNYVLTRNETDPHSIGVCGFCNGGFPAIFLAALDERIDAVVASGCITSFDSLVLHSLKGSAVVVPGLSEWLEASDCLSMLAPRPFLAQWGQFDTWPQARFGAMTPHSQPTIDAAGQAYSILDSAGKIETIVSPGLDHEVDAPAVVDFFLRVLPIDEPRVSTAQ
jgi:hypothetical protein